jgi:hypothetical protein
MPISFEFSDADREAINNEALRRQSQNQANGVTGRNGGPDIGAKALQMHILGAAGELAVAKYLGLQEYLYAEKIPRRGSSDLPPNIDVKTRSRHYYDLICQLDESLFKILVLVTIQARQTLIHGWITSKDAMNEKWIKDPAGGRKAFFVPKSELLPIDSLKHSDTF